MPKVSLTVPDGRSHLVVYGTVDCIDTDPDRALLTAEVFAVAMGSRQEPASLIAMLDQQRRTVLAIRPERVFFQA